MRPEFDYAVSFEAVSTFFPQTYCRGEIEFHSLGLPLADRIRKMLEPFEQPFIAYVQDGIRALPRKLWKISADGSREEVGLPADMARKDAEWEKEKLRRYDAIPVGDDNVPFGAL